MRWNARLGPDRARNNRPEGTGVIPQQYHRRPRTHPDRHDRIKLALVDSPRSSRCGTGTPPRGSLPMSHPRRLSLLTLAVVVALGTAACVTSTPGWTYTLAPSATPPPGGSA